MKSEEIIDVFNLMEGNDLVKLLHDIKDDAESYGLDILNNLSNTVYQDFVDLILYNIDTTTYIK